MKQNTRAWLKLTASLIGFALISFLLSKLSWLFALSILFTTILAAFVNYITMLMIGFLVLPAFPFALFTVPISVALIEFIVPPLFSLFGSKFSKIDSFFVLWIFNSSIPSALTYDENHKIHFVKIDKSKKGLWKLANSVIRSLDKVEDIDLDQIEIAPIPRISSTIRFLTSNDDKTQSTISAIRMNLILARVFIARKQKHL